MCARTLKQSLFNTELLIRNVWIRRRDSSWGPRANRVAGAFSRRRAANGPTRGAAEVRRQGAVVRLAELAVLDVVEVGEDEEEHRRRELVQR